MNLTKDNDAIDYFLSLNLNKEIEWMQKKRIGKQEGRPDGSLFQNYPLWRLFTEWPAASKHHHNYKYGLLQHTIEVCMICSTDEECTPALLKGAFWHDMGKLIEYQVDGKKRVGSYHIPAGIDLYKMFSHDMFESLGEFDNFAALVIGMIETHHGRVEWGSLRVPNTTLERKLHKYDMLSAQLGATYVQTKMIR